MNSLNQSSAAGAASQIRVLIADDDPLVRAGIIGILTTTEDIQIAAEAEDGGVAVDLALAQHFDVVLLDIQMPRVNGLQALRQIRHHRPELPVAMLTTFSDDHLIADAVGGGALGFLLKSDDPDQLIAGVRALAGGGGAFSPSVARWLARRAGAVQAPDVGGQELRDRLTDRQLELLREVARGHSNREIASLLHLSEGTVKQYLSSIFMALGVDNRVQAAIMAYNSGLLSDRDL